MGEVPPPDGYQALRALAGIDPIEGAYQYLAKVGTHLQALADRREGTLTVGEETLLRELALVLDMLLPPTKDLHFFPYRLELRRGRGRPKNPRPASGSIAIRVRELEVEGWPTEAAVAQVETETGLSRPTVYRAIAAWKRRVAALENMEREGSD